MFEARLEAALAGRPAFADVPFAKHLDPSTFLDETGRVDRELVNAFAQALPEGAAVKTPATPPEWGGNAPYVGASGVEAGRELHKRLHDNKN